MTYPTGISPQNQNSASNALEDAGLKKNKTKMWRIWAEISE